MEREKERETDRNKRNERQQERKKSRTINFHVEEKKRGSKNEIA